MVVTPSPSVTSACITTMLSVLSVLSVLSGVNPSLTQRSCRCDG